jgi:hypothetical protein
MRAGGRAPHRVERGPDRAAGVEHVVDEHDRAAVDVDRDLGLGRAAWAPARRGRRGTGSCRARRRAPRCPRSPRSAPRAAGRAGRRGSGCRAAPGRQRPGWPRAARGRAGAGPGRRRRRRGGGSSRHPPAEGGGSGSAGFHPHVLSFPASRDRSLKETAHRDGAPGARDGTAGTLAAPRRAPPTAVDPSGPARPGAALGRRSPVCVSGPEACSRAPVPPHRRRVLAAAPSARVVVRRPHRRRASGRASAGPLSARRVASARCLRIASSTPLT